MKIPSLTFLILTVLLPLTAFCASPDELAGLVMSDLHRRDENKLKEVAYSMTETAGDRTTLYNVTVDGAGKEHKELVAVNGKPASEKAISEYAKEEAKKEKEESGKGDGVTVDKLADMIVPGSLELVSEDDSLARFRFRYEMKSDKGHSQMLDGTLHFDKEQAFVSEIHVANAKSFKADGGAKVSIFAMDLCFAKDAGLNEVVPSSLHMRIKGTAMLVIPFDQEFKAEFSNFARRSQS
jgi:hypothetical protein